MRDIQHFLEHLRTARTGKDLFNHYASVDTRLDLANGARIRCANLLSYLRHFREQPPAVIVVGEAAGYRGNRFTGIPFTSEHTLLHHRFFSGGAYARSACREQPWREASGSIVWETLSALPRPVMLWGIVPFHPHKPGNPLSNRTPTRAEQEQGRALFEEFRTLFSEPRLIAAGRIASAMLEKAGLKHTAVRHPSHGGKVDFQKGLRAAAASGPGSRKALSL
ncbi:MAG TPA: uracil-DNA glycosylase [Planctomycetota bacterium]|nr:uracil-DNA glycosylase [Planctomycetota bacterium]